MYHNSMMANQIPIITYCTISWLFLAVLMGYCNAFSPQSIVLQSTRRHRHNSHHNFNIGTPSPQQHQLCNNIIIRYDNLCKQLQMAGFPPPMGGGGPGGPPPPPMGGPMSSPQRSFGGPDGMGPPPMGESGRPQNKRAGSQSYNANAAAPDFNNPGGSRQGQTTSGSAGFQGTPDSGRGGPGMDGDRKGLGAIASGVRTPMDKYGAPSPDGGGPSARGGYGGPPRDAMYGNSNPNNRFEQRPGPGPMRSGGMGMPPPPGGFDERGPPPSQQSSQQQQQTAGGRPNNLRYEERDYGEYVTNLRRGNEGPSDGGRSDGGQRGGGGGEDYDQLLDEVQSLRKENALLKRSCQDLMGNMNELSNRLFEVDETLKKVASVFPSEDEMESLDWLLRR